MEIEIAREITYSNGWTERTEKRAKAAFDRYIEDLKMSLPANASFADIEKAMLKHSPQMMRETAEALANAEDFSPKPKETPKGYWRNGEGVSYIRSCWGRVKVATQSLRQRMNQSVYQNS